MTQLSSPVKIVGLSKNKVIAVIFVVGALLILMLFFGVFNSDEDKVMPHEVENKNETYQNSNTRDLIDHILHEAEEIKTRLAASATISQMSNTSAAIKQETVPEILPTIEDRQTNSNEQLLTLEEKARMQFNKKQIDIKYTSFSSRTLMYANKPRGIVNEKNTLNIMQGRESDNYADIEEDTNDSSINLRKSSLSNVNKNSGSTDQLSVINTNKNELRFRANRLEKNNSYLDANLEKPKSPYEIKAGSVIPATMINGLNSDLPGQVIAQVRENIYDTVSRKYLLIPQGSRLIGLYDSNILYGQERILVAWNRLIYPDGNSISLKAMPGTDLEGYYGFHDVVDNKYWKTFGMSFIMGVLTGIMQYSQNNTNANVQVGGLGITSNSNPTIGQTLSGSLGQQLGQTGLMLAQKNLNVQPTLIVKPNYPFNIMVTADMILRPYKTAKSNTTTN